MANPVEAYRKLQKKREKEKLRRNRLEIREAAKLLQDPDKLKQELDQLSHKSIIGRVDEADSLRKEKLEKLWERHAANLSASSTLPEEYDDSTKKSESSSSSEDESDSEDEAPKCVIEIGDKAIPNTKPVKRKLKEDKLGDDFALELLSNAPVLPSNAPQNVGNHASLHHNHAIVRKAKALVAIPRPPMHPAPPQMPHMGMPPVPPPPLAPAPNAATKEKKIAIALPKKDPPEVKAVPLSSYFVPN